MPSAIVVPGRDEAYHPVAVLLHWAIAACIFFCLIVGTFMESLPEAYRSDTVRAHASSGMSVLVLSLIRVLWRVVHRPPPLEADLGPLERLAAKTVHLVLYPCMLAMPLIGWAIMSAHPASEHRVIRLFGAYDMPVLPPLENITPVARQDAVHDSLVDLHSAGAWLLFFLLLAHVGGALKHQFLDGRPQLRRMSLRWAPRA